MSITHKNPVLIIIRGNSASGKSTVAKKLQHAMGYGTMRIPQDVMRREILRVKDGPNNPSIELIKSTALYGKTIGYHVIIEGILAKKHYGAMLETLIKSFDQSLVYYFDIDFDETLRRHATKATAAEYGETEMRAWWNDHDYLHTQNECLLPADASADAIVGRICADVARYR